MERRGLEPVEPVVLILIGSEAQRIRLGLDRVPKDIDFIAPMADVEALAPHMTSVLPTSEGRKVLAVHRNGRIFEFEVAWTNSQARALHDFVREDSATCDTFIEDVGAHALVPSLDVLYALKSSHRFRRNSPHFLKTMRDRQAMRAAGASIPEALRSWYSAREKETYAYKHPNLNQGKMGFFSGDGIDYVYDHDSIHQAMKLYDRPAYAYFQRDGAEVAVDRSKFDAMPAHLQVASVVEESYVLALERSQVPFRGRVAPFDSFRKALEKVCTSITSGWWRDFAYEHYDEALALYDPMYVDRFWAAVDSGVVRKVVEAPRASP